jgi:hypothetical protein
VHTARVPSTVELTEPAAVERPAAHGEWWLLDRLALAWSALSAVALYLLIGRGGWYVDDFLSFGLARQYPLDRRYLEITAFGHPQPGIRVLDWLLYRISPMNYPLATALECLGFGLMVWLVYRILRMAFRPSPWHLVLTAMVSSTALWVPVAAWWAAGPEIGGCAGGGMLAVYAMLRCYRGPYRPLWGALAGGALALGLSCYERTLFGGAFAAWFLLAVTCRSARPREALAVLRRAWTGYLALAVVAAGYLLYYLRRHLAQTHPGYTRGQLVHFLWICWSHALIPGLFGGTLHTKHLVALSYAAPPLWWLTGCQLALLALVGYGLARNRLRALLGWLAFGVLFLVAQYLLATARLALYREVIGNEFRYVADLLPLLVLTLAITLLQPAALPARADRRPPAGELFGGRRQLLGVGTGLIALCLVYLVTALPISARWTHARNVRYLRNLRADVARLDRRGPWSLYTTYAPFDVTPPSPTFGRYSQTSSIAALVSGHPVSADDLTKPMYLADPDGHLWPAQFRALASTPGECSTGALQPLQPLNRPLPHNIWNVLLSYSVSRPTTLRFAIDPGTGQPIEATGLGIGFPVSGTGRLVFPLRPSAIAGLRLDASAAGACISDVRIGAPVRQP